KARPENMLGRHDVLQRRLNNLLRRGRNDVEIELVAFRQILERPRKEPHVVLQADTLAGLHEMLAPNSAKIRTMEDQVAELRALLHEICLGKALRLVVKIVKSDEFAQYDSRIVETERLVEIAGQ